MYFSTLWVHLIVLYLTNLSSQIFHFNFRCLLFFLGYSGCSMIDIASLHSCWAFNAFILFYGTSVTLQLLSAMPNDFLQINFWPSSPILSLFLLDHFLHLWGICSCPLWSAAICFCIRLRFPMITSLLNSSKSATWTCEYFCNGVWRAMWPCCECSLILWENSKLLGDIRGICGFVAWCRKDVSGESMLMGTEQGLKGMLVAIGMETYCEMNEW